MNENLKELINKLKSKLKILNEKQAKEIKKQLNQYTPMQSKEQFQQELDKLNLPNNLKAITFTILDIGLAKLNRLPISVTQEDKISVKVEYYNHANSIMYVEGNIYGKYKYCDLESGIGNLEVEECFSNRANLKLVQDLQNLENHIKYIDEERTRIGGQWRKLHSFLNSILGLECNGECIINDEELILAVQEKLAFEKGYVFK